MFNSSGDADFTLIATGDSLIFQKISVFKEEKFLAVKNMIGKGDACFTNFETIMPNGKGFPRYKRDPTTWMASPNHVIDELVWMGFNIYSLANNHSMDYSEGGLLETLRIFNSKNLANAGTGKNLSDSREPAYLNTSRGKVALVAINTGDNDGPAGDPWMNVQGRPGLNPLRYNTTIRLEKKYFQQMCRIAEKLELPREKEGMLSLFEYKIVEHDTNGIATSPYEPDVKRNLLAIEKGAENADFVVVSLHNHIKRRPGGSYFDDTIEYISDFVEKFSRMAVDAGADAVLGSGTHCLNGVEIYNNHPIFYGLGNFIDQPYRSNPQPYDWFEARNLFSLLEANENPDIRPKLSEEEEERQRRRRTTSVIAEINFEKRKVKEVVLHPIQINKDNSQGGRPFMAEGENGREILERLSRLSEEYNTKIHIEDNKGIIKI